MPDTVENSSVLYEVLFTKKNASDLKEVKQRIKQTAKKPEAYLHDASNAAMYGEMKEVLYLSPEAYELCKDILPQPIHKKKRADIVGGPKRID